MRTAHELVHLIAAVAAASGTPALSTGVAIAAAAVLGIAV
jgi:hypothetical protein